ncbi:MAG: hypothetical protein K2W85_10010, partial [Phycisphaerales bacterium]|nr:hypothetical protein [Phycisphaerales bacterium]
MAGAAGVVEAVGMEGVGGLTQGLNGLDGALGGEDLGAELGDGGDGLELRGDVWPSGPGGDGANGDLESLSDGVERLVGIKEEGEEFGLVFGVDELGVGVVGGLEGWGD